VYWNTVRYKGSPAVTTQNAVSMVSGFSPAVLKNVLSNGNLTPDMAMLETLEKYVIKIPSSD